MNHERHYTVEQANAAIDFVVERLGRLRAARATLDDDEARAALHEPADALVHGWVGRRVARLLERRESARQALRPRALQHVVAAQEQRPHACRGVGGGHAGS